MPTPAPLLGIRAVVAYPRGPKLRGRNKNDRWRRPHSSNHRLRNLGAKPEQVEAAVKLIDEGATVPLVARYRKEVTGGLNDAQLRNLSERLVYLRELDQRRTAGILESIRSQGKLTDELEATNRRPRSPRPSSKTFISPISRSAAPRRK